MSKKKKKRILTPQKEAWAQGRDVIMRGEPLRLPVSNEVKYVKELESLVSAMTREVRNEITKLFTSKEAKEYYAQDETISSRAKKILAKLRKRLEKRFTDKSRGLSTNMISRAEKSSEQALGSSLEKLSGGLKLNTGVLNTPKIKPLIQASIEENVNLIKSIPDQYLNKIEGAVMRSITQPQGEGVKEVREAIEKVMEKEGGISKRRAKNIALDQTRKAYNHINKARMENLGVTHYRWIHSGGGNPPRRLHKYELNGKIFAFDYPPIIEEGTNIRGIPGDAINCRCVIMPVLPTLEVQK